MTEECFQQTPLDFVGTEQEVRAEQTTEWITKIAKETRFGTWPEGSMWRKNHYFTIQAHENNRQCRGQIKDYVKVPKTIPAGKYVLSFRWDAEASPQVWNGCASIDLI